MIYQPFMRHNKPIWQRFARLCWRWFHFGRKKPRTIEEQILWLDALLETGFVEFVIKDIHRLRHAPISAHQRFHLHLIHASALHLNEQPRQAIEELQTANDLARTIGQKAELLQKEGKCRAELQHWHRAHWCFEHALILRKQANLTSAIGRSQKALDLLAERMLSSAVEYGSLK